MTNQKEIRIQVAACDLIQNGDDLAFAELELVRAAGLGCSSARQSITRLRTLLGQLLQSGADRVDTVMLASAILGLESLQEPVA